MILQRIFITHRDQEETEIINNLMSTRVYGPPNPNAGTRSGYSSVSTEVAAEVVTIPVGAVQLIDENGNAFGVKNEGGKLLVISTDEDGNIMTATVGGEAKLKVSDSDSAERLKEILLELKKMNLQLIHVTDIETTDSDIT